MGLPLLGVISLAVFVGSATVSVWSEWLLPSALNCTMIGASSLWFHSGFSSAFNTVLVAGYEDRACRYTSRVVLACSTCSPVPACANVDCARGNA